MTGNTISNQILGGGYIPGESILHRLGAGIKILLALGLLACAATGPWPWLAGITLVCLIGFRLSGYPLKEVFQRLKVLFWFLFFVGLFPVFFIPGTPVEFPGGFALPVTWEGLMIGLFSSLRLVLMFFISMILIRTTSPLDLVRQLEKICLRLPCGRSQVREFLTVGLLAFQIIPILCAEADDWLLTKWSLEEERGKGGLFGKARKAARLLLPLTVSVLNGTERFSRMLRLDREEGRG